jgi:hypothetical protein
MNEIIKHKLRQFYYEYLFLPKCEYYYIFKKIYELSDDFWEDVIYDEKNTGFIITDFINPHLKKYSGREVAFFNESKVHVFWLPGAAHSGQGYVENASYEVILKCGAMKEKVLLSVIKNNSKVIIQGNSYELNAIKQPVLDGGYVFYNAIKSEIKSRILDCLVHFDSTKRQAVGDLLLSLES